MRLRIVLHDACAAGRRRRAGWATVTLGSLLLAAAAAGAQLPEPWSDDPVVPALIGDWQGSGTVYGSPVKLTREWSFDLAGHFVRADMGVEMANGAHFRALAFWRPIGPERYESTWMDELGQRRTYEAVGDPSRREITAHYLETFGEEAGWRRITYRVTGEDSYRELMYVETTEGWKQIADFEFSRLPDPHSSP